MKYINLRSNRFFRVRGVIAFFFTLIVLQVMVHEVFTALKGSLVRTFGVYDTSLLVTETMLLKAGSTIQ